MKISKEEGGMLFMLIGVFVAIMGLALGFLGAPTLGWWIGIFGFIIGAAGLVAHFIINANQIFRINK